MDSIPEDPYLKFHPDTMMAVRQEYNLHQPGAMEEVVKNFQEWIDKQNHFVKKDFTKHFVEASIILSKGSLERAKKNIDKLCTLKTLVPKFFSKHDPKNELIDLTTFMTPIILPTLTDENYRVFMLKITSSDITTPMFLDYYTFITIMCEYMKAHDYTKGFECVLDARDVNILNYAMNLNVIDMRNLMGILMEGYGTRIKSIHIISESKAADAFVAVIRQFVSPKVGQRILVHKTLETLYEHFPKDILPEEYGGKDKPLISLHHDMVDLFSTKENVEYFKDICRPGTDEALRHTAQFNNDILGMPGSFRSLTVD